MRKAGCTAFSCASHFGSMVHRRVPPDSGGTARAVLACRRALVSQLA
ncbi:hypothetical protein K788_0004637 [Paraburkholderia caribensis MBA4]|uniref:Uncharacterized protein n=1 Tax=Paraburkholderia caribensis MBA4 TaxID=1323664 RepID=A0A0P0RK75_9BURK|nr:hypothetical protein K788_0004637 [Paraburkholderia caribensis MBA4]